MDPIRDFYVLYPVYIDLSKKISEGRKYSKDLCVLNPTFLELCKALQYLEIECTVEKDKRHPRDFFRYGRFKINKMYGKKNLIEGLRDTILKNRCTPVVKSTVQKETTEKAPGFVTTNKGEVIENKLNLVARRKIKPKKGKKK